MTTPAFWRRVYADVLTPLPAGTSAAGNEDRLVA